MSRKAAPGRRRVSSLVDEAVHGQILKIAAREGRDVQEAVGLLISIGLRESRRRGSLMCGFTRCTRKDCCGSGLGRLIPFRLLAGGATSAAAVSPAAE